MAKGVNAIDVANEWLGKVFCFLIVILMFVVVGEVIMRYVFNAPSMWAFELSSIVLMYITFLGAGYCLLHGGHVKVDIVSARLPPRTKAIMDLIKHPGQSYDGLIKELVKFWKEKKREYWTRRKEQRR